LCWLLPTIYVQSEDEDGSLSTAQLNTKKDFSSLQEKPVTIKLSLRKDKTSSHYKVSVVDATELPTE